jgi:hypothetical protein
MTPHLEMLLEETLEVFSEERAVFCCLLAGYFTKLPNILLCALKKTATQVLRLAVAQ